MTWTFPDLSLPDMRKRKGFASWGDLANLWTMADYAAVWRYRYCDLNEAPPDIACLTLTRADRNWQRIFEFEKLRELHLYDVSAEQFTALSKLNDLTALSILHSRPKDLSPLAGLSRLQELSLEYVSGVSSLAPLGTLPKLAAIECNNLRGVSDFSGLSGSPSLRFLRIGSTAELGQAVKDFDFLTTLSKLEGISIGHIRKLEKPLPLKGMAKLCNLAKIAIGGGNFPLETYAQIEATLGHIDGATEEPAHRSGGNIEEISTEYHDGRIPLDEFLKLRGAFVGKDGVRYRHVPHRASFLGKGVRDVMGTDEFVTKKCRDYEEKYRKLVERYRAEAMADA